MITIPTELNKQTEVLAKLLLIKKYANADKRFVDHAAGLKVGSRCSRCTEYVKKFVVVYPELNPKQIAEKVWNDCMLRDYYSMYEKDY